MRSLINGASIRIPFTHVCRTIGDTTGSHAHHSRAVEADAPHPGCSLASVERGSVVTWRWEMRFVFGALASDSAWRFRDIITHGCCATVEPASTALTPHLRVGVPHDGQHSAPLGVTRVWEVAIEGQHIPCPFAVVVHPLDATAACVGGPAWVSVALTSTRVAAIAVGEVPGTLPPCLEGGEGGCT